MKVNGKEAGRRAYGYNAFRVDATPYVKAGRNSVEIDLNNMEESSRWYHGGGIYRPVKLIICNNPTENIRKREKPGGKNYLTVVN